MGMNIVRSTLLMIIAIAYVAQANRFSNWGNKKRQWMTGPTVRGAMHHLHHLYHFMENIAAEAGDDDSVNVCASDDDCKVLFGDQGIPNMDSCGTGQHTTGMCVPTPQKDDDCLKDWDTREVPGDEPQQGNCPDPRRTDSAFTHNVCQKGKCDPCNMDNPVYDRPVAGSLDKVDSTTAITTAPYGAASTVQECKDACTNDQTTTCVAIEMTFGTTDFDITTATAGDEPNDALTITTSSCKGYPSAGAGTGIAESANNPNTAIMARLCMS